MKDGRMLWGEYFNSLDCRPPGPGREAIFGELVGEAMNCIRTIAPSASEDDIHEVACRILWAMRETSERLVSELLELPFPDWYERPPSIKRLW